jgi:hypothetical protein
MRRDLVNGEKVKLKPGVVVVSLPNTTVLSS